MIELYTWTTPNGEKPIIMLEEVKLDYELHMVNIGADEQRRPEFLAISPNGKIPAIVDKDDETGIPIFESGAILVYLAEKAGQLLPASGEERAETLSWTFFQAGHIGPMLGQWFHFKNRDEPIAYAVERFRTESLRSMGVLNERLKDRDFLTGTYSIADVMNFSWVKGGMAGLKDYGTGDFTALAAWVERIGARPAVKQALEKLAAAKREHE
ncbi:glutathione S-transferase N-terminal domain-containing protein [Consotaella sp. CSK11QG-6]